MLPTAHCLFASLIMRLERIYLTSESYCEQTHTSASASRCCPVHSNKQSLTGPGFSLDNIFPGYSSPFLLFLDLCLYFMGFILLLSYFKYVTPFLSFFFRDILPPPLHLLFECSCPVYNFLEIQFTSLSIMISFLLPDF